MDYFNQMQLESDRLEVLANHFDCTPTAGNICNDAFGLVTGGYIVVGTFVPASAEIYEYSATLITDDN